MPCSRRAGGTGISARDGTYNGRECDARETPGWLRRAVQDAELCEMSGPAAMLSRACAGLARGRIVVAMPGSETRVSLAMQKLLLPELGHMVREARR